MHTSGMTDPHTVFQDLVRLQIELWNAVDTRLRRDVGISLAQFGGIHAIGLRDECRVLDVADELVITIGGASKLVDRIEANGLCERRLNPADGRSSLLHLTDDGRGALERATGIVDDELSARLERRLTASSLQQFGDTLALLRSTDRDPRS